MYLQVIGFATGRPPSSSDSSSKLAAAPRCKAEADLRCVLVSACGTRVLPEVEAMHLQVIGFAPEAAFKLRLIKQACGCSTVRDGGGLKKRACLSASGTKVERPLQRHCICT